MNTKTKLYITIILILSLVLASGCIYMNEPTKMSALPNLTRTDEPQQIDQADNQANQDSETLDQPESPISQQVQENTTIEEFTNGNSVGIFATGDTVDFKEVQGTIISGSLENGRVIGPPFQINNDAGPALVYASSESQYGFAELFHYPQRGTGEGEADLYLKGELVSTVKFIGGVNYGAYIMMTCDPETYPDSLQAILQRHKNCE